MVWVHRTEADVLDLAHSGFRLGHGAETAFAALIEDLLVSVDRGQTSILIPLHLSAVFNTVDHETATLPERGGVSPG